MEDIATFLENLEHTSSIVKSVSYEELGKSGKKLEKVMHLSS